MIVCVCKNVSSREIAQEVAGGCASFRKLQRQLDLGTCCGVCLPTAREVFAESQQRKAAMGSKTLVFEEPHLYSR